MPSYLDDIEANTDQELGLTPAAAGGTSLDAIDAHTDHELAQQQGHLAGRGPDTSMIQAIGQAFGAVPAGVNAGADDLAAMLARAFGDRQSANQFEDTTDRNLELAGADAGAARQIAGASRSLLPMVAGAPLGPVGAMLPGVGVSMSQAAGDADRAGITGMDKAEHVLVQGGLEAIPELIAQKFGLGGAETMLADAFQRQGRIGLQDAAKGLARAQPAEVGTELTTSFGQAAEDKRAGIDQTPWTGDQASNIAKDTIIQTLLLTGAAGAPGLVQGALGDRQAAQVAQADAARPQVDAAHGAPLAPAGPNVGSPDHAAAIAQAFQSLPPETQQAAIQALTQAFAPTQEPTDAQSPSMPTAGRGANLPSDLATDAQPGAPVVPQAPGDQPATTISAAAPALVQDTNHAPPSLQPDALPLVPPNGVAAAPAGPIDGRAGGPGDAPVRQAAPPAAAAPAVSPAEPVAGAAETTAVADKTAADYPVEPGGPGTHEVYHGTSNGTFSQFDPYAGEYGLLGGGTYFTKNPEMAKEYTKKGKGGAPAVYKAQVSLKNPMDMDGPADVAAWEAQIAKDPTLEGTDFAGVHTNEEALRRVEDTMAGLGNIPRYEAQEIVQGLVEGMGHDGITHIGGGRAKASKGVKHRVYIAFHPEQIAGATRMTDAPAAPPAVTSAVNPADASLDIASVNKLVEKIGPPEGNKALEIIHENNSQGDKIDLPAEQKADENISKGATTSFDEAAADGLSTGMAVEIRLPRGRVMTGTVDSISPTGRVRVRSADGKVIDAPAIKVMPLRTAAENLATSQSETPIDIPEVKRVRTSSVDSPAQGDLNAAKANKADTWQRVKTLRQQVKAKGPQAGNLRLLLLQAEGAHRQALEREKGARSTIEKRAQELGQTTKPPEKRSEKTADLSEDSGAPENAPSFAPERSLVDEDPQPNPAPVKDGQQAAPERALGDEPAKSRKGKPGRIPVAPIATTSAAAAEPVARLKSIIRRLRQSLTTAGAGDPGLYEGEAPKGTGGIFDENTGMAAIARHGDLDATAHEVGHRIAYRFRLDEVEGQQGMPAELADFSRFGSEPPTELNTDQRAAYRKKEAWAEFIRAVIVNPSEAAERAPAMQSTYDERVPAAVRDALKDYGDAARRFLGLAPEARTEANIQSIKDLLAENKFHVAVAHWFGLPEAMAMARQQPRAFAKLTAFMREVWSGMGKRAQDTRASASQATPERLKELRRMMPTLEKFGYLWQNVWGPAYARFAEGYARRGVNSEKLPPEKNFRILNRLMAGNDGRALEQVFGAGLVDGRYRPVVDFETGERLNWRWLMDPVESSDPATTLRLIDKALALAVEQRTAAEGDKRMDRAAKEIEAWIADLDAAARGEEDVDTLNRLIATYQELTGNAADAAGLRVETLTLARSGRKADVHRLNRWTEKFATARRRKADEEASRITGIGGGLVSDTKQAKAALANRDEAMDKDRPAMDEFLRRYRRWANHLVQVLTEKGLFTADQAKAMQEAGEWTNPQTGEHLNVYVDLHRMFEGEDTSARVGGRFQGSTRMIANPLRNLVEATLSAIDRGERNQAMNAMADAFRGGNDERVDLHDLGRQVPAEAVEAARKEGGSGLVNGRKPYRIMREGVPEWWTFDPAIEASMESARANGDSNLLVRMWGQLTRLMRAGITTAPSFIVRNIMRDTEGRLIGSESARGLGIRELFEGFGSLPTAEGKRTVKELSRIAGGSYAGYVDGKSILGAELAGHLDQLLKRGWQGKTVRALSPKRLLELAEKAGESAEQINRRGEFVSAFKQAKAQRMDDYNASLYAADKSRGLIDFAEAGLWGRQLTRVVLFFNPAIQGLARFARTWKLVHQHAAAGTTVPDKLKRLLTARAVVAMGAMTAASVALRLMVRAAGGQDDEEAWRQQPAAIRDFHWMIPMPGGLPNLAIPKEYSWGFFMSGAERLADAVMAHAEGKTDEVNRAFEGYASSAAGALLPINDISSVTGGFGPLLEASSNYDSFRQRAIVPTYETGKDLSQRDVSRSGDLGKALQRALAIDARLIEHVIEGYGGQWGRLATSYGKEGKGAEYFATTASGLAKNEPGSAARDVEWVRDFAGQWGLGQKTYMRALSAKLKAAYSATTDAEREKATVAAREYATKLRAMMEKDPAKFRGAKAAGN